MRRISYVVAISIIVLQLITLNAILNTSVEVDSLNSRVDTLEQVVTYNVKPVVLSASERDCLARNMYYEAGNQSPQGQIAVAQVTLNRVRDGRWGNKICSVVYSKAQFSWTLNKKKRWAQPKGPTFDQVKSTLARFEQGTRIKGLEHSLTYHADYIEKPFWAKVQQPVKRIGAHIFYVDKTQTI
jgi:spore germination cell wall hydrolase CwlJ-like protein